MCGIAGLISTGLHRTDMLPIVQSVQGHRGPDSCGLLQNRMERWNVTLVHQRLSILDLSSAGHQPMQAYNGKDYIIFNGEVYNYKELRVELIQLGYKFRSDTDTEVILTALIHWGPDEAMNKFNGMWAFAWLDQRKQRLIMSRDRVGIKPLYYYLDGQNCYFASEIKTILALVPHKFKLNVNIVGNYLLQSIMETSTETFFEGIMQIPAGYYGELDLKKNELQLDLRSFWKVPVHNERPLSENVLVEQVRDLFMDAVKLQLRSDVPVGVLLSGGVDSSAIAAVMANILGKEANLNIFSAVSLDSRYDESPFIDIMAKQLNQDVHKVVLDFKPEQAFAYLEQLCWFNDQPVGSFSNVAHYLLMKEAKEKNVTVILSGQGADELLCGYKKFLGFYLQNLFLHKQYGTFTKVLGSFIKQGTMINQFNLGEAKRYLPALLKPKEIDIRGPRLCDYEAVFLGLQSGTSLIQRQALDIQQFSVPVLTHYEDRMSMAWSREIRVPFLDYRLIEMLVPLPAELKLKNGWSKYIFRKAMEPFLPQQIVWRKDKKGFANPESEWLKHELKAGVLEYFTKDSLIFKFGLVERAPLLKKYELYCRQSSDRGVISYKDIFNPMALEIWLRKFEKYISFA
ncbi:MAG: hypothetical protein JWM44_1915 [Bacilli bacterium]|nr:hypothetical protein [Bacilli bacterium]